MNFKKIFFGICTLCLMLSTTSVNAYTLYNDPLQVQPYVEAPADVIKTGMTQYQWQVETEQPGKIVAVLDYKKHVLKVNVHYTAEKIWLEQVSAVNNGPCKTKTCKLDDDAVERWHLGLYRGIALALTKEALRDASTQAYK